MCRPDSPLQVVPRSMDPLIRSITLAQSSESSAPQRCHAIVQWQRSSSFPTKHLLSSGRSILRQGTSF